MQAKHTIDFVGIIESIFFRMFYNLFNSEGIRSHLGFAHINFYMNQHGMPGWHLWLDGQPGAYQIELADQSGGPDALQEDGDLPVKGQFIVRYFPDEEESAFSTFSFFEQMLRASELFDHTGTPTVQARQTLHPSYYVIGQINIKTRPERDILELECCAPDLWQVIRSEGLFLETEQVKKYRAVRPGGKDRNVPSWHLCFFLYDKIIQAFCCINQRMPILSAVAVTAGCVFIIDSENNIEERKAENLGRVRLLTTISCDRDSRKPFAGNVDRYAADVAHYFSKYDPHQLQVVSSKPTDGDNAWINSRWWEIGEMHFHNDREVGHLCCLRDH